MALPNNTGSDRAYTSNKVDQDVVNFYFRKLCPFANARLQCCPWCLLNALQASSPGE